MPLGLLKLRSVATSNIVGILWSAAMFAMFFLSALYLQLVLGYSPLEVGLAFLPANLIMGAFSLGLSARIVMRYGTRLPLVAGMGFVAVGLALFARAPVDASFAVDVLPSMVILGIGIGMAMNPLLLAAMSDVKPEESGLASGIVNTSFMMGGALGLAVLASVAAARTGGDTSPAALTDGYHAAFLVGTRVRGRRRHRRGRVHARRPDAGRGCRGRAPCCLSDGDRARDQAPRRCQALRRDHRRRRPRSRRAGRDVRRPPGPERRRQVDDDAAADRAGDPGRGRAPAARILAPRGVEAGAGAARRHAAARQPRRHAYRRAEHARLLAPLPNPPG